MGTLRFIPLVLVLALGAIVLAAPAGAARVDEPCSQASGANGATACTFIVDMSVSGPLESDVVIACLGEDIFLDLRVHVVGHQLFRPDGSVATTAGASIHGDGYGLLTGTRIVFNENGEAHVDDLPNGGTLFHTSTPAVVVTKGGAINLEFNVETQFVIAPDGTVTNSQLNAHVNCGSDHERLHQHG
jgi:hypothetical protein